MALSTKTFDQFGGLNLALDDQESRGIVAADLENVEFDYQGRIRRRDGIIEANTNTTASLGYNSMVASRTPDSTVSNFGSLIACGPDGGANIRLDKMNSSGAVVNLGTFAASLTAAIMASADFGSTSASYTYLAISDHTTNSTIRRYTGAALSSGTGAPKYVAISPRSNRLVQGHYTSAAGSPSGANGSTSTVFFSDEGAPDTYTATNFVPLKPGDGEEIVGIVTWRDDVYVVKQTRMFVFYGESVDDAGLVEFNYREVSLGGARIPRGIRSVVIVGDDGVYLSAINGIYKTTGGVPTKISTELDPIYTISDNVYAADKRLLEGTFPTLSWANGHLYADTGLQSATYLNAVFVWSPRHGQWSIHRHSVSGVSKARMTSFTSWPIEVRSGAVPSELQGSVYMIVDSTASVNEFYRTSPDATADDGTAFNWYYQSAYYRLAAGEARTRFTDIYGSGTATFKMIGRGGRSTASADAGAAHTLGSAAAIPVVVGRARHRGTVLGREFAHRFSGTSAEPARIHSITTYFAPGNPV